MPRMQTALVFWLLLSLSIFVAAVRAGDALWPDLSLIGYDDRGTQPSANEASAQPCQSCPPGTACQACLKDGACSCDSTDRAQVSGPAPMILNLGPPPKLYSPSTDFSARVAVKPSGVTIVGDEGIPSSAVRFNGPMPIPAAVYPSPASVLVGCAAPNMGPMAATYTSALPPAALPTMSFPTMAPPTCMPATGYPNFSPTAFMPAAPMYFTPTARALPVGSEADRLDHMLQAIHHLEAAGLQAEADRLRGECDARIQQVANQLRTSEPAPEPFCEADFHRRVSDSTSDMQHEEVTVNAQMFEISRQKCVELGFDYDVITSEASCGCSRTHDLEPSLHVVAKSSQLLEFINLLKKEGVAELLAAPKVITRSGQSAHLSIGHQILRTSAVDTDKLPNFFGAEIEVQPTIVDNDNVRLRLRPTFSQVDDAVSLQINGRTVPSVKQSAAEFTVDVKPGQTVVVAKQTDHVPTAQWLVVFETEIGASKNTTTAMNHPQRPVVVVARSQSHSTWPNTYPVQQAGYVVPSKPSTPDGSFNQMQLPAPFTPQPIEIDPTNGFGGLGDAWKARLEAHGLSFPWMFDDSIFTPDLR